MSPCNFVTFFSAIRNHFYINADLKISLFVLIHIKVIPWKFWILNPKNSRVIRP